MLDKIIYRVDVIVEQRKRLNVRLCFESFVNNWKIEQFKTRKNSELAQSCLLQWSISVKLRKIGDRYNPHYYRNNQPLTKATTNMQSQQTFNPFEVNLSCVTSTSYTDEGDDSSQNMLRDSLGVPKPISLAKVAMKHQMSLSDL